MPQGSVHSMGSNPTRSQETTTTTTDQHDYCAKPTGNTSCVRFSHLPPDTLYRIASKLPPKELARTAVLSSEWRRMWSTSYPRLTFDVVAICKCRRENISHRHIRQFIVKVNDVLHKHRDKVVDTLEVKVDFIHNILSQHIDTWVDFALSSRTKSLTLDLKPERFFEYENRYVFPFHLLDRESTSRLQHMKLSFGSLNPPPQFKGFPNLMKLHLQALSVTRNDLEHMLSHCCTLEWLYIDKCHLHDELIVDRPLPRLLYLRVDSCRLTKIKFDAVNLATFEYDGSLIPIDLLHSLKLKSANIDCLGAFFQHMLTSFLNGLPGVESMTLHVSSSPYLEKQWLWDNPLKFSNLRHLQLLMFIRPKYEDQILYSVLFLRAMPFIEKLEVHFAAASSLWLAEVGPCRKDLGQCQYNYLKDIWITGFKSARGQLEFLLHIVENAPALEVLLVEIGQYPPFKSSLYRDTEPPIKQAKKIAETCLSTVLPENVMFHVKE